MDENTHVYCADCKAASNTFGCLACIEMLSTTIMPCECCYCFNCDCCNPEDSMPLRKRKKYCKKSA